MTPYKILKDYYDNILNVDKWPVFTILRELYRDNKKFKLLNVDPVNNNYENWDELRKFLTHDRYLCDVTMLDIHTFTISQRMYDILEEFKKDYIPKIDVETFEGFVLTKIFLNSFGDENIKRFILYCMNFANLLIFLEAIDLLYMQKFNNATIELIFSKILFRDVYDYVPNNPIAQNDIITTLISKERKPIKITLKRLIKHTDYINNYKVQKSFDRIVQTMMDHFKQNEEIIKISEFHEICKKLYDLSFMTKGKLNVEMSRNIANDEDVLFLINRLNALYANVLILVLFKHKEETSKHQDILYTGLIQLYKYYKKNGQW